MLQGTSASRFSKMLAAVALIAVGCNNSFKPGSEEASSDPATDALRLCTSYSAKQKQVVYDDTADATALPAAGDGRFTTAMEVIQPTADQSGFWDKKRLMAGWVPSVWRDYLSHLDPDSENKLRPVGSLLPDVPDPYRSGSIGELIVSTAFLHGIVSPAGRRFLVSVSALGSDPRLVPRVWEYDSHGLITSPVLPQSRSLSIARLEPEQHIQLFSGVVNPTDHSRFAIAGLCDNQPFEITGQLGNDGTVVLTTTNGWVPSASDKRPESEDVWYAGGRIAELKEIVEAGKISLTDGGVGPTERGMDFSSDGKRVGLVGDAAVEIIDLKQRKEEFRHLFGGINGRAYFSPDLSLLLAGNDDWDITHIPDLATLLQQPRSFQRLFMASFYSDGKNLLVVDGSEYQSWDLTTRKCIHMPHPGLGVIAVTSGSTGAVVAITYGYKVRQPTAPIAPQVTQFAGPGDQQPVTFPLPFSIREYDPLIVSLSEDGDFLAVISTRNGNSPNHVHLIDLKKQTAVFDRMIPGEVNLRSIRFSPDHHWLSVTGDNGIYLLETPGCGRMFRMDVHDPSPPAFSPDGKTMTAYWDAALHFWPVP